MTPAGCMQHSFHYLEGEAIEYPAGSANWGAIVCVKWCQPPDDRDRSCFQSFPVRTRFWGPSTERGMALMIASRRRREKKEQVY